MTLPMLAGRDPGRPRQGRLLALGGALLALFVAIGAGLIGWTGHARALSEAGRELRNMSVVLADHTDRALQAVEIMQSGLSERMHIRGATSRAALARWAATEEAHDLLRERMAGLPQLDAVLLVDAEGRLLSFSRYWPAPPNDLSDREYFRALRDGAQRFIGEPVRNRGNGTWTIHVARRLEDAQGGFMGMIVGVLETEYFEHFFGSLALGPGSSIILLRADGTVLARHPPAPEAMGRSLGGTEQFRTASSRADGTPVRLASAVDGQERLVAARALSAYPLRIHAGAAVTSVLAYWRQEMLWLSGGTALLLALVATAVGMAIHKARAEHAAAEARLRGERELAAQSEKFRTAVEGMSQGLWKFDGSDRLELTNRRCTAIIGMPGEALQPGATLAELRAAAGPARPVLDRLAELVRAGLPGGFLYDAGDGRAASVRYQPLPEGGWLATFEDVSERRAAEARIAHMARHDALTGLPNRAGLQARLKEVVADARLSGAQMAVLHFDLDRFKVVNDTLGHAAGDALLRAVTARLQRNIRARRGGGDMLARLGADEFVVVVAPQPGPIRDLAAEAATMARRLIGVLSEPFDIAGHEVVVGASAGVALFPRDGGTAEALLQRADLALHVAKQESPGRACFFEPGMDARAQARRRLERDLRRALAVAQEEFELHYQPLVEVATRRPTGFEALLRWRHPERGLVSPAEFIPLAEEMGLIVELGALALRRACAEAAGWARPLRVAVNLSPVQFRSPALVETVAAALRDNGLEPGRLELEITEGVLLHETEANMATLRRLKALGLRIAMDDFGTGYSSLSYLRSFPFDKVKIDRAFVRDLETRTDDAAIVQAVTGLCARLGMVSTAEGVETEAQFDRLARERCVEVQGYLFSRPVPAAEIPALLARLSPSSELAAE